MNRTFSSLHARAFAHATEDIDRVKKAMTNALGDVGLRESRTEGHHGNPITVLEATFEDPKMIRAFLRRLSGDDLRDLLDSLDTRVDDGCNLFLKIDKQEAFAGRTVLGSGDDVISVRMKVMAFPAKAEIAKAAVRSCLEDVAASEPTRE